MKNSKTPRLPCPNIPNADVCDAITVVTASARTPASAYKLSPSADFLTLGSAQGLAR